ncbi:uncharacterized protein LOC130563019 [Triplophysa rosa]|uniref:uncharacterized protein LOC130563019 n=1 Tax=Triplophysa rosa TaxID=992332 RepID=UPI00254605DC|nr:uncharacterized protein LOC130563019 [Triplophysa rosa]
MECLIGPRREPQLACLSQSSRSQMFLQRIANLIDDRGWTEKTTITIEGIPKQMGGNNCGMYILMYTLYMALGLRFYCTERDMPLIRRWWCAFILDHFTHQIAEPVGWGSSPPYKKLCLQEESEKAGHAVGATMYQLPVEILTEILKQVILTSVDSAYLTLSLVCRWFRDVIKNDFLRRGAHFAWLDSKIVPVPDSNILSGSRFFPLFSTVIQVNLNLVICLFIYRAYIVITILGVVNWKHFSPRYREKYRVMYSIRECLQCRSLFKSSPPGYRGRGKQCELLGFYSEDLCEGFCSQDCFYAAGNTLIY